MDDPTGKLSAIRDVLDETQRVITMGPPPTTQDEPDTQQSDAESQKTSQDAESSDTDSDDGKAKVHTKS